MTPNPVQIWQCTRPGCSFRFPAVEMPVWRSICPHCGAAARLISAANPDQRVPQTIQVESSLHLEVFLDNIRSAFNVGAMLRAADGAGINHMHLAGITPTPDNPKVAKTALGAERSIPWTYHRDGVAAVDELRKRGLRIWAMEGGSRAEPIFQAAGDGNTPTLLVVGNEVSGIDPGILALSEKVLAIPMLGVKNSLNVAVAFGIAVYVLRFSGFVFQSPQPGGLDNS